MVFMYLLWHLNLLIANHGLSAAAATAFHPCKSGADMLRYRSSGVPNPKQVRVAGLSPPVLDPRICESPVRRSHCLRVLGLSSRRRESLALTAIPDLLDEILPVAMLHSMPARNRDRVPVPVLHFAGRSLQ